MEICIIIHRKMEIRFLVFQNRVAHCLIYGKEKRNSSITVFIFEFLFLVFEHSLR